LQDPGARERLKRAALRYQAQIARAAREAQVDPRLMHAVITVESGYNPTAVSPKGASGLMQLMPDTARRYGATNLFDPGQNLRAGAQYLRDLLELFSDDLNLVLAAYNAGENAVHRYGNRIPPYAETQAYVPRVLQHYDSLRRETPANCVWRSGGKRISCRYS
jgi:soluble lytic murein transglycosylase-like protein